MIPVDIEYMTRPRPIPAMLCAVMIAAMLATLLPAGLAAEEGLAS